jgi:hypothetical protein
MEIMRNGLYGDFGQLLSGNFTFNSAREVIQRDGIRLQAEAHINLGAGTHNINVLQLTGAARVVEQYAIITDVTNIADITDVYADLWDGTLSTKLTKTPGSDFSGIALGSFFTKDKDSTNTYSLIDAATAGFLETNTRDIGYPFVVNQKNGVDTFIRFNFTTGAGVNFKMQVYFKYQKLNGGTLEFL